MYLCSCSLGSQSPCGGLSPWRRAAPAASRCCAPAARSAAGRCPGRHCPTRRGASSPAPEGRVVNGDAQCHHPPAAPGECPWPPGGHGPGGAGGRAQPAPAGTFSSCDERMERSSNSFFLKWDNSIIVIQLSPIIIMEWKQRQIRSDYYKIH